MRRGRFQPTMRFLWCIAGVLYYSKPIQVADHNLRALLTASTEPGEADERSAERKSDARGVGVACAMASVAVHNCSAVDPPDRVCGRWPDTISDLPCDPRWALCRYLASSGTLSGDAGLDCQLRLALGRTPQGLVRHGRGCDDGDRSGAPLAVSGDEPRRTCEDPALKEDSGLS